MNPKIAQKCLWSAVSNRWSDFSRFSSFRHCKRFTSLQSSLHLCQSTFFHLLMWKVHKTGEQFTSLSITKPLNSESVDNQYLFGFNCYWVLVVRRRRRRRQRVMRENANLRGDESWCYIWSRPWVIASGKTVGAVNWLEYCSTCSSEGDRTNSEAFSPSRGMKERFSSLSCWQLSVCSQLGVYFEAAVIRLPIKAVQRLNKIKPMKYPRWLDTNLDHLDIFGTLQVQSFSLFLLELVAAATLFSHAVALTVLVLCLCWRGFTTSQVDSLQSILSTTSASSQVLLSKGRKDCGESQHVAVARGGIHL